jgi:8-oxo-dGTP pyrophosphatase MutT (NUDIX family)
MSTAVRVVLVDRDDRVLLLRRAHDDDILPGFWEFPGGGIDAPETPEEAARRELSEEVGMDLGAARLSSLGVFERTANGRTYRTAYFTADCGTADCHPALSAEHSDWRWLAATDALPQLTPSARWAIARRREDGWPRRRRM